MAVPTSFYLVFAVVLFFIGAVGAGIRRNSIVVFMCIELMLNGVNVAFVALSRHTGNLDGQVAVFFVMVLAAAEAAVGLAIMLSLFRVSSSIETQEASELKW
jgi:NADH-quinone oxidoreductase subunit K